MENINVLVLKIHPTYLRYAADNDGNIIDISKKRLLKIQTQ